MILREESLKVDVEDGVLAHEWGFPVSFIHGLRESFEYNDIDGSESIDRAELVPLLTNLDCPPCTALQKRVLDACLARLSADSDESGKGAEELTFAMLVRLILEYSNDAAHEIFVSCMPEGNLNMPVSRLTLCFCQAGRYAPKKDILALLKEMNVDT